MRLGSIMGIVSEVLGFSVYFEGFSLVLFDLGFIFRFLEFSGFFRWGIF